MGFFSESVIRFSNRTFWKKIIFCACYMLCWIGIHGSIGQSNMPRTINFCPDQPWGIKYSKPKEWLRFYYLICILCEISYKNILPFAFDLICSWDNWEQCWILEQRRLFFRWFHSNLLLHFLRQTHQLHYFKRHNFYWNHI